jgi:hypothetical protein
MTLAHLLDATSHTTWHRDPYLGGSMPVFSHVENDIASLRMITSQFCVNGYVKQSDVIRTLA